MSGPLQSITSELITKALDVSLHRQEVIANNIANSDTAGFRPMTVNFADIMQQLKTVVEAGDDYDAAKSSFASIEITAEQDFSETSVLLDQQVVEMVKNTTHYQALLSAREQLGGIMKLAITGARG
jgi:flagellar basal-body rod protein FlgB